MGRFSTTAFAATAGLAFIVVAFAAGSHTELYRFDGPTSGEAHGMSVGGAGDVNADGFDDLVVGSPLFYNKGGTCDGRVMVYSGKSGKTLYTFRGNTGDWLGMSVDGAGDFNADGWDDIVAGGHSASNMAGCVRVFSGKDGTKLLNVGGAANSYLGYSVSGAGDVNQDGYDDVIAGAMNAGTAFVYSGKDGKTLYAFSNGIFDVGGAGDVNKDGYPDLILGRRGAGQADVYSGKDGTKLHTFSGVSTGGYFGHSVSGAGDVNADGYDDLVVGEWRYNNRQGAAKVFSGKDGKVLYVFYGDSSGDVFGKSVSGAGDVNGDGYDDVMIAAFLDDNNGSNSGNVRVYSGKDGTKLYSIDGGGTGHNFGRSVSDAGDANNNGRADFIVGAAGAFGTGAAYVYASPGPAGTLTINRDAKATNTAAVTLDLTWEKLEDEVTEMRLRNAGDSWGSWLTVVGTMAWVLPSGEGEKTVEVQYRDTGGVRSAFIDDSIILDQTNPTGSIVIDGGADWAMFPTVNLGLISMDLQSGVQDYRLRNDGELWTPWLAITPEASWELLAEEGLRTVTVEYRDAAGNVSEPAEDTIGLDTTPPTFEVTINDGDDFTGSTKVTVAIDAEDGAGSGVNAMRLRSSLAHQWPAWKTYEETTEWTFSPGDGAKELDVQVRDLAGNVTQIVKDRIVLDQSAPTLDGVRINNRRPYVLPTEDLELVVVARDNLGGSGVDSVRVTFDRGATWSAWAPLAYGHADIEPPQVKGLLQARAVVRDAVGNESARSGSEAIYVIEDHLPNLGSGAKFAGGISTELDVDALSLDLAKGDLLSVKIVASTELELALDLVGPDGDRLFEDRYPADVDKLSILGYQLPATGRYLLIVRRDRYSDAPSGTYKLKAKVKQAKVNKKGKETFTAEKFTFNAVHGSKCKLSLKGEGIEPGSVTLVGPDGPVTFEPKGKSGKVSIKAVLEAGTGTYTVRFGAAATVAAKWSLKLPKIKGTVGE